MKRRLLLLGFAFLALVPITAFGQTFTATLTGSNEPDGVGDPDGTGYAVISISGTTVNYLIVANNLSTITNAHIHRGINSKVEIGFPVGGPTPLTPFVGGVAVGSVGPADQGLINEIVANPNAFYVNVHSTEKTGGAIRGNLNGGVGIAGQDSPSACSAGDTTLCLNSNRFRAEATWKTPDGKTGVGHAVRLTADSGYFWFFNSDNAEMIVKSLNACSAFNSQWVFSSGLTNVQVTLKVTDTQTGKTRTYTNPLGAPFQPIQDTSAFACP